MAFAGELRTPQRFTPSGESKIEVKRTRGFVDADPKRHPQKFKRAPMAQTQEQILSGRVQMFVKQKGLLGLIFGSSCSVTVEHLENEA